MKKLTLIVWLVMFVVGLGTYGNAYAQLSVLENALGHKVLYFPDIGYWYQNLPDFTNQNLTTQLSNIDQLNTDLYFGQDNWQMASFSQLNNLISNAGLANVADAFAYTGYSPSYTNGPLYEWIGRLSNTDVSPPNYNWTRRLYRHETPGDTYYGMDYQIWGATDVMTTPKLSTYAYAPAPEPGTLSLLGVGLIGIWAIRRKKSKK